MRIFILLLLFSSLCGILISPSLSNSIGRVNLINGIPWLATLPGLVLSLTVFIWWKFVDLSGTEGISIKENEKLNEIIKAKVRFLQLAIGASFLSGIIFIIPRLFSVNMKSDSFGDYVFSLFFAAFILDVLILFSVLIIGKELTDFTLEIKHKIKDKKERKEFLNDMQREGKDGFSSDEKLDSYNHFHNPG